MRQSMIDNDGDDNMSAEDLLQDGHDDDHEFNQSLDNHINETRTMDTGNAGKRTFDDAQEQGESQGLLNFGASGLLQGKKKGDY